MMAGCRDGEDDVLLWGWLGFIIIVRPRAQRQWNEIPGKLFLIRSERRSGTGATDSAWLDQWVGDLPGVREKSSTRLVDKGGNELD